MRQTITIRNPVARILASILMITAPLLWWTVFPLAVFAAYRAMYG